MEDMVRLLKWPTLVDIRTGFFLNTNIILDPCLTLSSFAPASAEEYPLQARKRGLLVV